MSNAKSAAAKAGDERDQMRGEKIDDLITLVSGELLGGIGAGPRNGTENFVGRPKSEAA